MLSGRNNKYRGKTFPLPIYSGSLNVTCLARDFLETDATPLTASVGGARRAGWFELKGVP